MTLREMAEKLDLVVVSDSEALEGPLAGGYVSDLLSHVMGKAKSGQIWITMQGHQNIVAVASLIGLAAVVVADGIEAEEKAIQKAQDQEVILCKTNLPVYEIAGRLYKLGIKGASCVGSGRIFTCIHCCRPVPPWK